MGVDVLAGIYVYGLCRRKEKQDLFVANLKCFVLKTFPKIC